VERARLAVALLFDHDTTAFVDALRAGLGERRPERIPPHITLVPPSDPPVAELVGIWEDLRSSVTDAPGSIGLELGPVATFAPRTPTIHLEVTGVNASAERALRGLQEAVALPALRRRDRFGFHPHATLRTNASPARIEAAIVALEGLRRRCEVDRVTLLRHAPGPPTRWDPIGEVRLAPRPTVQRGADRLEVDVSRVGDPSEQAFWERLEVAGVPDGWTLSARVGRDVVGAARCRLHPSWMEVRCIGVWPSQRRQGVGRLLVEEAARLARRHGVERLEVATSAALPPEVAAAWGFAQGSRST
jgi:2'-5' RNA ligase/GNAT superfamily N-acetyltransferase